MRRINLVCLTVGLMCFAAKAQVSFDLSVTEGCAPLKVEFINTSSVEATLYRLDIGSDTTVYFSEKKDTTIFVNYGGEQNLILRAWNGGSYLGSENQEVRVKGAPKALSINPETACPGDQVQVWAMISGAQNYEFDFGDGRVINDNYYSQNHIFEEAGTYPVTVVYDFEGCPLDSVTTNFEVGKNVKPTDVNLWINSQAECPGDAVYISASNHYAVVLDYGDGTFQYGTPGNGVNSDHTYQDAGDYVVTATFQNGCNNDTVLVDTARIRDNLPFNGYVNISMTRDSACPTDEINFQTYYRLHNVQWNFGDGSLDSGYYVDHAFAAAGEYRIEMTAENGCGSDTTLADTMRIVSSIPVTGVSLSLPDTICTGSNLRFSANGQSTNTYIWDMGDGTAYEDTREGIHAYETSGEKAIELSATNGCGNEGTYRDTVVVDDNHGVPPLLANIVPDVICPGDTFMLFTFPGGLDYSLNLGNGTVVNDYYTVDGFSEIPSLDVIKHTYSTPGAKKMALTSTNACGQSRVDTFDINVNPGANASEDDYGFFYDDTEALCPGDPVVFYAAGLKEFDWNFGDGTGVLTTTGVMTPVEHVYDEPGEYIVSVTGRNGCGAFGQGADSQTVVIPDTHIEIVANGYDADCGENTGRAIAGVSGGEGPYTYAWSSGDTTQIADSLESGIYVVEVFDVKGCSNFGIATVSDEEAPTIFVNTIVDVSCAGGSDGAIDINVIGGNQPYTFKWSNGKTTEDVNNLAAGPYELYVEDATGCTATVSIVVEEPDGFTLSFNSTPSTCNASNGSAQVNVSGSTDPYSYIWGVGGITQEIIGKPAGVYGISVIDKNGCLEEGVVIINDVQAPKILTDSIAELDCGQNGSGVYISLIGGTAPFSYDWSNATTNEDLSGVGAGNYTVEVSDANSCSAFASFTIEESAPEAVDICLVTVDTATNTNKVVWSKTGLTGVDYFNVYRESSQSGLYFEVGQVDFDSLSVFTDSVADPSVRSWRYKISAVDDCGNESDLSAEHKTIHLTSNLGVGGEVNLIWDYYEGFTYNTYKLWRYTDVNGWEEIQQISSNLNSFTDNNLPSDFLDLSYLITVDAPSTCVATRAENHNSSRSNRKNTVTSSGGVVTGIYSDGVGLQSMALYPNPAQDNIQVELYFETTESGTLRLVNIQGKEVKRQSVFGNYGQQVESMSLEGVSPGVYFIRAETAHGVFQEKLVVE